MLKKAKSKFIKLHRKNRILSYVVILVIGFFILYLLSLVYNNLILKYDYSEAGYIVSKTSDNTFHYIIEDDVATPIFEDFFYFTIFVDDQYIKIQIPYKVFSEYNLGDHFTVYRKENIITKKCKDYDVLIQDIHVPAQIIKK